MGPSHWPFNLPQHCTTRSAVGHPKKKYVALFFSDSLGPLREAAGETEGFFVQAKVLKMGPWSPVPLQFPVTLLVFFHEKLLASLLNLQELHWLLFSHSETSLMQSWARFAIVYASRDFPRHCDNSSRTPGFCKLFRQEGPLILHSHRAFPHRMGPMNMI